MKTPRFSIIIPTLNEEKFLPNLLTSLTRQTQKDFEVIVVDGQSRDSTVQTARRFGRRLPLTVLRQKQGVSRQRNTGAKMAKGDWLVFVDADSVLLSNFIERIDRFIRRKNPSMFTTWFRTDYDDAGNAIMGLLGNMLFEGLLLVDRPCSPGPLTVIKTHAFHAIGGYDESSNFTEDYALTLEAKKRGILFHILREILYTYSMRRYRKEGLMKAFDRYFQGVLTILLTNTSPKYLPGFVAGGSQYSQEETQKHTSILAKKLQHRLNI